MGDEICKSIFCIGKIREINPHIKTDQDTADTYGRHQYGADQRTAACSPVGPACKACLGIGLSRYDPQYEGGSCAEVGADTPCKQAEICAFIQNRIINDV